MFFILQTKSAVSYERSLFFTFCLFWPLEGVLKKSISFFFKVGACCTRVLLSYMCHSMDGHVLKTHYVGWWNRVTAHIFRMSFQLQPITWGSRLHLNEVYVRFQSLPFFVFLFVISLHPICCVCNSWFCLQFSSFLRSPSSLQGTFPFSTMSFVSDSTMGMGDNDFGGSIQ